MAYQYLDAAKRLIQQRGIQAPEGVDFDTWAGQWFENALNAGDPAVVQAAGGGSGAGWGQGQAEEGEGGIADWRNAAPSSEWLGKRAPNPRELRRYARDQGWSEDFQRYDDRQLADWLNRGQWDVASGRFAGGVEKPTETGGALAPTGYGSSGYGGGGGGGYGGGGGGRQGGGAGGGYGGAPEFTPPTWENVWNDPGVQSQMKLGTQAIQGSAAAKGLLRSGGTLKDIMGYAQDLGKQSYGDAFNRALQGWQTQYQPWSTVYDANLQKYLQGQQSDLSKYLQKEEHIYGLGNPNMPIYG